MEYQDVMIRQDIDIPASVGAKIRALREGVPLKRAIEQTLTLEAEETDKGRIVSHETLKEAASLCGVEAIRSEGELLAAIKKASGVQRGAVTFDIDPSLIPEMELQAKSNGLTLSQVVGQAFHSSVANNEFNQWMEVRHVFFGKREWPIFKELLGTYKSDGAGLISALRELWVLRQKSVEQESHLKLLSDRLPVEPHNDAHI